MTSALLSPSLDDYCSDVLRFSDRVVDARHALASADEAPTTTEEKAA